VIITICHLLKTVNDEIEEFILDNIISKREGLSSYEILNEIANHFHSKQSLDDLIPRKNHNLLSSVAFLLTGKSSKRGISEINALLLEWNLNESNIFLALCLSFNVLLEIFLSDLSYFSYGEFFFDRDLVIISQMDLNEIFKAKDSFSESNPMLIIKNDINEQNDRLTKMEAKMEAKFDKIESNFEKMMELILSMKVNQLNNEIEKVDLSRDINKVSSNSSLRKDPKIQKTMQKPKSSSPKPDKGNLYSPLVLNNDNDDEDDNDDNDDDNISVSKSDSFNNDEIEEYSDEDSSLFSNSNAYTTSEITFIKDQTLLWKSNIPNLTFPREIHALSSLAENKGLLIAQASGQLVQMKFPKTLKCNQNLFTLGSKYIDCQTNILFPRSFPEMCTYFSETTLILQRLVGGDIECDSDTMNWATKMIQFFPRYTSQLSIKFNHGYNRNYSITQYAILLRLHLWCMNVTVINKNPSFLSKVDSIWDKFIRYDFEAYPTNEKLLSACALVGYRCTTCHKLFVPTQLCPVCFSLQTISKAVGPFTSKTQLEKDYQLWLSSSEGIAWVTSNVKSKAWDHYYSKIATATQRDSHNKIKKSGSSPKFTSLSKCLGHYAANQHEIPLLCGSDHHTK
jgi:hypothetical protein